MLQKTKSIFLKGLFTFIPIALTFYVISWAFERLEGLFSTFYMRTLGPENYIPGLGVLTGVLFILVFGVLVSNFITGRVIKFVTSLLEKVPLLKTVYGPIKDLMSLFSQNSHTEMKRVVMISPFRDGQYMLGLVTREDLDVDLGLDLIAVYVPFSYMLGGQTFLVEAKSVQPLNISVEKALKLSVTGWVKSPD